jgi:hypothetical protein
MTRHIEHPRQRSCPIGIAVGHISRAKYVNILNHFADEVAYPVLSRDLFWEAEWTGCLGATLYPSEVEMGNINWVRVIICGIVAGLVWTVLTSLITAFFSKELWPPLPAED